MKTKIGEIPHFSDATVEPIFITDKRRLGATKNSILDLINLKLQLGIKMQNYRIFYTSFIKQKNNNKASSQQKKEVDTHISEDNNLEAKMVFRRELKTLILLMLNRTRIMMMRKRKVMCLSSLLA